MRKQIKDCSVTSVRRLSPGPKGPRFEIATDQGTFKTSARHPHIGDQVDSNPSFDGPITIRRDTDGDITRIERP